MANVHRVRAHKRNGHRVRAHWRRNPGHTSRTKTSRNHPPAGAGTALVLAAGLLALWLVLEAVKWAVRHWWVILLVGIVAAAITTAVKLPKLRRPPAAANGSISRLAISDADAASPRQFEAMIGALLRRDGLVTRLVGGGNDMAVDVVGTDPHRGWILAVQCKHTTSGRNIAVNVLYQIFGTAAACYDASHQIVVTNGGFTTPAVTWGRDPNHRVHLIDRTLLAQWIAGRSILDLIIM